MVFKKQRGDLLLEDRPVVHSLSFKNCGLAGGVSIVVPNFPGEEKGGFSICRLHGEDMLLTCLAALQGHWGLFPGTGQIFQATSTEIGDGEGFQ